ncbi:ehhadh, partial [Symbiodinium pilosum]
DWLCEQGRFGLKTPDPKIKVDPEVVAKLDEVRKMKGMTPRAVSDEEGYVARSSDIDLAYIYGYGFPPAKARRRHPKHAEADNGMEVEEIEERGGVRFASFFSRSIILVLLLLLALLFFVSIITSRIYCHLSSVIIKILGSVVLADCIRNQLSFFMVSRAFVMPRQGGPMFYAENYAGFKKILERVKYYNQQAKDRFTKNSSYLPIDYFEPSKLLEACAAKEGTK